MWTTSDIASIISPFAVSLMAPAQTVQYWTVFGIPRHDKLGHRAFSSSKCIRQRRSLPQKGEIKKPRLRCEIVSRLDWFGEQSRQVPEKRNCLRAGRYCE